MELGIVIVVAVIAGLLAIWKPPLVMAPVICMFGIEQFLLANSAFFRQHGTLVNYGIGALVLLALISVFTKGGRINFYWPVSGWLMLALYGLYALSTFWSISAEWNRANINFALPYIATVAIALPMVFRKLGDVQLGLTATLILATMLAFVLLFGTQIHVWGRTVDFGETILNRYGLEEAGRGNPLALADLGASLAIIAIMIRLPAGQGYWGALRWVAVFAGMALIFRSGSRGQYVGLLISVALCYKFSRPKIDTKAIVGLGVTTTVFVAVLWIAMASYGDRDRYAVSGFGKAYGDTRLEMSFTVLEEWTTSTPMNFLLGLGGGACWKLIGIYPHVVPIEILVELGVLGLAIYVAVMGITAWKAWRLGKMTVGCPVDRATVATLVTLLMFHLVMGFKQGSWLGFHAAYFLVILIARMEWQYRRTLRHESWLSSPNALAFDTMRWPRRQRQIGT